ncbi:MAG: transposase [Deltaproteobacteria bacterium]|nr:transposase [Deltaproteobacteria bacterium]
MERYKIRSGVEATQSELKRAHGLAKLRVRKAPKVIFAIACKVTACNIKRWAKALFDFWLPGTVVKFRCLPAKSGQYRSKSNRFIHLSFVAA